MAKCGKKTCKCMYNHLNTTADMSRTSNRQNSLENALDRYRGEEVS